MQHHDDKITIGLKKAHTHLTKVIKMVEEGDYCIDIMQQNLAVIGLLKSAHQSLMEGHLGHCFSEAVDSDSKEHKQKMIEEILQVSRLSNK